MADPGVVNLRDQAGGAPRGITSEDVDAMQRYLVQSGQLPGDPAPTQDPPPATQPDPNAPPTQDPPPTQTPPAAATPPAGDEPPGYAQTMADIAQAFGVETDEFLGSISVDGHDGNPVSLSDVIDGYNSQPGAAETVRQRDSLEADFRTQRDNLRREHEQSLEESAQLAATLRTQLFGQAPSPEEMARVRIEDPERYKVLRLSQLEGEKILQESNDAIKSKLDARQREIVDENTAWVRREEDKLLVKFPELADGEKARKFGDGITTYLRNHGIEEQHIGRLQHAEMIDIVRKAKAFDELQAKGKDVLAKAKEKGLPLPKRAPGQRGLPKNANQQSQTEYDGHLEEMAKHSGSNQRQENLAAAEKAFLVRMSSHGSNREHL